MRNENRKKGLTIIEVMLAAAIFAIFAGGIVYLSLDTIQRDSKVNLSTEAILYAQEGIEATRNIRDQNFLLLTNGDHGVELTPSGWTFITAPENIDGFYNRTVTVEDVYRDELGNISTEGIYLDADTKKITSEVTWMQRGVIARSIVLTTYLSNWTGSDWIETTCSDFDAGTFDNTGTTPEIPPPVDNCGVILASAEIESNFFSSADIGQHATDVRVEGNYAYIAVNDSQNGFAIIDVSDAENPFITNQIDIGHKGRYLTKNGNYILIGVENSKNGFAMVDVSNPNSASLYLQWDVGDYGNEAAVSGDYMYLGIDEDDDGLQVYYIGAGQLPNKDLVESFPLSDSVKVIEIDGNYAYVGTGEDDEGLQVVNISNPENITYVSGINTGEEVNAITITGATAFVGTEESSDSLQVINISNPASPQIVTSLNVGGEIQDLVISGDYLYAAIDSTNSGLAAINISNPFAPYLVYNLDIQGKGEGIDADANYVYVATDTANKGLVIIGTTLAGIIDTGSYISEIFDTGSSDPRYNYIDWDHIEAPSGTVKFQMRTADTLENIETATWVGIDGTADTYYENPRSIITLDPSSTGSRYCQYIAFIESDGVSTPIIQSVRINYTP